MASRLPVLTTCSMYRRTISLFSNLPTLKVYRKGIQNLAPALEGRVPLFTELPRRNIIGNPYSCKVMRLGDPNPGHRHDRGRDHGGLRVDHAHERRIPHLRLCAVVTRGG